MKAAAREIGAAVAALFAYLATVLPQARRELRRWRELAEAIPDPERRRLALAALEAKESNVEAVAVFATLAPLRRRRAVLRAIVPLQLAIDYRDVLEEAGEEGDPDSLLTALDRAWVQALQRLAGCDAVAPTLRGAVARCAEGQRRTHAAARGETEELERWASELDPASAYRWWELAAGASSSVAAHALIAAAAEPDAGAAAAALLDAAYDPPVGALTVLLDDLVDLEADRAAGEHNYLAYYGTAAEAAERLAWIAEQAGKRIEALARPSRHRAILAGVGAFYLGSPGLEDGYSTPIRQQLLAAFGPGTRVLASFVRLRGLRERKQPGRAGNSPGP